MSKVLNINDLLIVATRLNLPVAAALAKAAEALATIAAVSISAELNIEHLDVDFDSETGGACVIFYATSPGQPCASWIHEADPEGEFQTRLEAAAS